MSDAQKEHEAYLARVRARLKNQPEEAAPAVRVDAPTFTLAPAPAPSAAPAPPLEQPSAYSESTRVHRGGAHELRTTAPDHLAEELGALAAELTHESLEVLVLVGRRLARAEERAP